MSKVNVNEQQGKEFLEALFKSSFEHGVGEIELRPFLNKKPMERSFHLDVDSLVSKASGLCSQGVDVYVGVNPRIGGKGKKENVHYLTAFHAEIDYGRDGHKKESGYSTREEAREVIECFSIEPTVVVHSGGGFHVYWVLNEPLQVTNYGIDTLESINRHLSNCLGGDPGTHDISRVLRLAGTYNFKISENPRPVTIISNSSKMYDYEDFRIFAEKEADRLTPDTRKEKSEREERSHLEEGPAVIHKLFLSKLAVSDKIKHLIRHGNDGSYESRSEADMAVVTALLQEGESEEDIRAIFQTFPIGKKYKAHSSPESYLTHNINKAKDLLHLSDQDLQNPLLRKGIIRKEEKGWKLDIVAFQEYMVCEQQIVYQEEETSFFRYNGKSYEPLSYASLSSQCQGVLGTHRRLFTPERLKSFRHYAIGDSGTRVSTENKDFVRYLTLQNGLYDIETKTLADHTPDIFTTNLLPYEYDPDARCPRFEQFLSEIFPDDQSKITFIKQAIGYIFHKSIPTPAMFFLIGKGNNGKSVFLDVLEGIVGSENRCTISLRDLSNEYYILNLCGKMVNISSETPKRNLLNTDLVKAVVGGDCVTGRAPYGLPQTFRPYCKHFLAMNESPEIEDQTYGMWRRIYVIEFPRVFTKDDEDKNLTRKLLAELPGIFNLAIEGYKALEQNDFRFPESEPITTAKSKLRSEISSVISFASEHFKTVKAGKIKFSEVYQKYSRDYCKSEDISKPKGKTKFRETLEDAGYDIHNSTKDGNQKYIFSVEWSDSGHE